MPADHGRRLDEHQMVTPVTPGASNQDPEQPIAVLQAGPLRARTCEDRQLVAQHEVLSDELARSSHRRAKQADQEEQVLEHAGRCWCAMEFCTPTADLLAGCNLVLEHLGLISPYTMLDGGL